MNSGRKWVVLGVSGVTCGGKSTLAEAIYNMFPGSVLVHQDRYFLPVDDTRHTFIPHLNHINWEIATSLDMEKMRNDIREILSQSVSGISVPLLIIEGFLIFTDPYISSVCQQKIFFTLPQEECRARRSARNYDPPDVPGYFEDVVWPEYEHHLQLALTANSDLTFLSGTIDSHKISEDVKYTIVKRLISVKNV